MKWGIRRSKKWEKRALRAKRHGNTAGYAKRHVIGSAAATSPYRMLSSKTYNRIKNKSTGRLLVESLVFNGSYGALKYNELRADKNDSIGKAFVKARLYGLANHVTLTGFSQGNVAYKSYKTAKGRNKSAEFNN